MFACITRPGFKPLFGVRGPLLPLRIWKTGTQQTATPRVLMVMAVVDVVYEGIMFDGILWPPLLWQLRAIAFAKEKAALVVDDGLRQTSPRSCSAS